LSAAGGNPPPGCIPSQGIVCPWKMKPWYDAVNSQLTIVSGTAQSSGSKDCGWPGSTYVINSNDNDFPLAGCGRPVYVWAKRCTAAAQTVDFKKTMFLPGVPAVLEASLRHYTRPLRSMEILVNGRLLLKTTSAARRVDLKSRAGAFRFGNNGLELVATKGPTKKACNGSSGDTAVLMELHAEFKADLEVTIDPPNNTGTALYVQHVTVKNNGPAAVDYGSIAYKVSTSNLVPIWNSQNSSGVDPNAGVVIYQGADYIKGCMYYSQGGYSTYCPIDSLQPGESRTYEVKYIYKDPGRNFSEKWTESWGASGDTLESNPSNNGGQRPRGACRPPGNPPPCG
jgi:hypothetical protein